MIHHGSTMTLTMSKKEIDRFDIIKRLIRKEFNGSRASELLGLSVRHVRRLKRDVKSEGAEGLIDGNRGRLGNRRVPEKEKKKIVDLLHKEYSDFGPTFAAEKLFEKNKIDRDPKTIRAIQIVEGLWTSRKGKKKSEHRDWRLRKESFGEML